MRKPGIRRLLGFLFLTLLLLLFFGYYQLGGLNPLQVEMVRVDNYYLIGRYFQGNHQSDTIRLYFNEMNRYVEEGILSGHPAIIYDQEPEGTRGKSKSFIGILTKKPTSYGDLKQRQISATECIRVYKNSHISVMPNPAKIEKLIRSYAEEHGYELDEFNVEIYHPSSRLVIERPIRKQH